MRPLTTSPVAANLRTAREAAGITVEDLADRLGVRLRRLQRWLSGDSTMPWPHVAAAAVILNRPVEWFYAVHDERESSAA